MYLAVLIRTRSFYRHLIAQLGGVSGGGEGGGGNLLPKLMLSKYKGCLQNGKFCMNPHTSSEIRITSTTELPNGNKL